MSATRPPNESVPLGKLIVISGPSGSGKSTICQRLLEHPRVEMSVSATTRKPRGQEEDGVDYHFVDRDDFRRRIEAGEFVEYAEYCGELYGTLRTQLEDALARGAVLLLEIEVEGARQVSLAFPSAIRIFVLPPDRRTLHERLAARGTESEERIAERLEVAELEMAEAAQYRYHVVNDDLDAAVAEVRRTIGLT